MKSIMIKGYFTLAVTSVFLLFAANAYAGQPGKIDVCHVPADTPDNTQLIQVGSKGGALADHLSHGDWEVTEPICEDDIADNNCDGVMDDPNAENYDCVLQTGNANAFCDNKVCFIATAELSISSPIVIAGTYNASKGTNTGSQSPFNLSGLEIVPANPLNADTPLVNDLTGKIVLISSDGFNTSSLNKADNAAIAGAVAAIIYNSDQDSLIAIFGSNLIPTISVGKSIGESMLANMPVIGGMQNLP